ncbi:hypothetical protein LCM02_13845 [Lutimonas saemankumensis]|uniref:hypothetical protein n=1 Tax=Lutimonas saemankumensis TaxID=483016 RepID=UPI001CD4234B|nr:hypothetical protein [Lutimonas saemankumensis]MCA0933542.1 hypothetical protein [Lutimonas saemankumensis]
MKNLARKTVLVFTLMMSLTVLASNTKVETKDKNRKLTNVYFKNVEPGSQLIIKDFKGLILYKEAIEKYGAYSKGFDLTNLPDGDYYFELDSDLKLVVIPFKVEKNDVEFDKTSESTIYKPLVRMNDNLVYVWRTPTESTSLSYDIYYAENNDLVHSESFAENEKVSKVYDFSTSKKGNYVFVFEIDGRKIKQTIKI